MYFQNILYVLWKGSKTRQTNILLSDMNLLLLFRLHAKITILVKFIATFDLLTGLEMHKSNSNGSLK